MTDDILLAKAQIVERCIVRAREELTESVDFATEFTRQDAAVLEHDRLRRNREAVPAKA